MINLSNNGVTFTEKKGTFSQVLKDFILVIPSAGFTSNTS